MIKARPLLILAAVASLSTLSAAAFAGESAPSGEAVAAVPQAGKMIFAANNQRLGAIYRVSGDSVQVIIDGKMISLPATTVTLAENGKYVTTLTKAEVMRAR